MDTRLQAFERLLTIMDDLREKCPWDKKQTLESLRYLSIEEMYELSDAILTKDLQEVKKIPIRSICEKIFIFPIFKSFEDFV